MSLVCSLCKVSHPLLLHPTCALLDAPIWAMFGAVTASGQILLHFHSIYLWEAHRGVTGLPAKLREPESSWSTSPFTSSTLAALPAAWSVCVWGCVVTGLPVGILLRRCCVVLSRQFFAEEALLLQSREPTFGQRWTMSLRETWKLDRGSCYSAGEEKHSARHVEERLGARKSLVSKWWVKAGLEEHDYLHNGNIQGKFTGWCDWF